MNYSRRSDNTHCLLAAAIAFASTLPTLPARAAPTGGVVTAGTGAITQQGATTTVTQTASPRMVIDWKTFSTSSAESIVFRQPDPSAIALNRVTGASPSQLMGSLSANGQVFILNPNGVLFGPGAQVDVRGLLASTLGMDNASFLRGSHVLEGGGANTVVNQGRLTAADGGYIALVGPSVTNSGAISARLGDAVLLAGDNVTVRLEGGSLAGYAIDRGSADALVNNSASGAIRASGGRVVLAADAADVLGRAVVNHDGLIEAQTLNRVEGSIRLLADARVGQIKVAGKLDATAPGEGNGGHIETSGAYVRIDDSAVVDMRASNGKAGSLLLDPLDFVILSAPDDNGRDLSSSIGATTLSNFLKNGDMKIETVAGSGKGDITVNGAVSWGARKLTLRADGNIIFNATLTGGSVSLLYGQSSTDGVGADFIFNNGAKIDLNVDGGIFTTQKGSSTQTTKTYTIVRTLGPVLNAETKTLRGISSPGSNDNYVLGADIIGLESRNDGASFVPLAPLFGTFDGLGHTIDSLGIKSTGIAGLFSRIALGGNVRNLGMTNAKIDGINSVGGITGINAGTISRSYVTGEVRGLLRTGGLVGENQGDIVNAYSGATVTGREVTGGLVGENASGKIDQSYSTGIVGVQDPKEKTVGLLSHSGGLVGFNRAAISNSYATGNTDGIKGVGGLIGSNLGSVLNSYATGDVSGGEWVGGLVGAAEKGSKTSNTYAAGAAKGTDALTTGGLVGALAPSGGAGLPPSVSNSYWKTVTPVGVSQSQPGTEKSSAELMQAATFSGWSLSANAPDPTDPTGPKVWRIYEGNTMPLLRSFLAPLALGATIEADYKGKDAVQSNKKITPIGTRTGTAASGSNAGTYQPFSNQLGYDLTGGDLKINKGALVITATADDKVYDGNTTAVGHFSATGVFSGDAVNIIGNVNFVDKNVNVGQLKKTSTSGVGLSGNEANNYSFNLQVASSSANITPAELKIEVTPTSKIYDGKKTADLTPSDNRIAGDQLKLELTGEFDTKDVGIGKSVALTGIAVSGPDASNYTYRTIVKSADITRALLKIEVTPLSKPYDGTTQATATLSNNGLAGDVLNMAYGAANFDNKNVGTGKQVTVSGITLTGTDAANYLYQPLAKSAASITPRPLDIVARVDDKVYDGTTRATATTSDNRIAGDVLGMSYQLASFADKDTGQQKSVSLSGVALSGPDALNYTTNGSVATTASITPKNLSIVANADRKLFDGTAYEGGNGVTVSGLVAGETTAVLSGQLAYGGDAQGAVAPGNYSIRPGGLSSANYATTFVDGALTVAYGDQRPATAIASATSTVLLPPTIARPATRLSNSTDLRLIDCGIRFPANLAVEGCGPRP